MSTISRRSNNGSELRQALMVCKASFLFVGFFSLFINLLLLVPTVYMLQVYDRVLRSGSESTLLMLTLIAVFLFLVMGGLERIRSQILIMTSARLDQSLGGRVFDAMFAQTLATSGKAASAQPLGDLLQLRQFLTGPGLFAFFDAPWMPIYIAVMFLFHPWFGSAAIFSALVLGALAYWNEVSTREDLKQANAEALEAANFTQRNLRNAEVIEAMGMLPRIRARWQKKQTSMMMLQGRASAKAGLITALSKIFRLTIQSLVLGLGAYLAIRKEISPGQVIAGSILLGRALAPLDLMITTWRGFSSARGAYFRLSRLLDAAPASGQPMPLPAPKGEICLEKLVIIPPGAAAPVIKGVSLMVEASMQIAIVGPSAAGKSTLVRAVLGIHLPQSGSVRLDGAELDQWDREALGKHIGYLPQDVELLEGSVSENIARFGDLDPVKVVQAAQAAGIHEMILRLPGGYETELVGQGTMLSAGQQQRLGLARALYGDPQVIVLDEPNSNLDQEGDAALLATLAELKRLGRTVIVVTHRGNVLNQVDKILVLADGQVARYGPRDQVLAALHPQPLRPSGVSAIGQRSAAASGADPMAGPITPS